MRHLELECTPTGGLQARLEPSCDGHSRIERVSYPQQEDGGGPGRCASMQACASCNKIAEAEAAVSVNKKKWLVMHMHVQLDELRGPPNPWLTVT